MPDDSVRSLLEQANRHHMQGQLAKADRLYRLVLQQQPANADALHYLGLLTHQLGQSQAGVEMLRRSVAAAPTAAPYHNNLAMVLRELGRTEEALAEFSIVIRLRPDHADAWLAAGVCLGALHRLGEAENAIRRALALRPNFPQAHNNLGAMLRLQKRDEESAAEFQIAYAQAPNDASINTNLGSALCAIGRLDEARQACKRAVELAPNLSVAWLNLATVLSKQRLIDQSIQHARRALELDPNNVDAMVILAAGLSDQGLIDEVLAIYRRAIAIEPPVQNAYSNYVYALHFTPGLEPVEIRREHEKWDARFAKALMPANPTWRNSRDSNRRLRIGYVGPTFRMQVVGLYFEPLLEAHDRGAFEIACYSDVPKPDQVTARLRAQTDLWRDTAKLSDAELADQIRGDGIDILIDLNLHMAASRLLAFARKPAPIQICHLGYPATTGLSAMDYAVTDVHLDPPGESDEAYTEKLIRLPDSYWCYKPPEGCPPINELPALTNGFITFGSLNNFNKINDQVLALWSEILAAVPGSKLALMLEGGSSANQSVLQRLKDQHGVPVSRLLIFQRSDRAKYMAMYHQIDIALDPFPYAGHTTSFDSTWMGLPLITMPCHTSVSRAGVTVLSNLGMNDLVAHTPEEYLARATRLVNDLPRLTELRATLRDRMAQSPLTDAKRYARNFEAELRKVWTKWCTK
ncbi:MAG TPA: tetratricopeptide repeat protein [Humisphaera sp.]|jgi:predicted O-linked N-acetylglucosamine transferase (SPINDLY family)|nr:tetratricopeptide repeat protein [Humisphaera sp.]